MADNIIISPFANPIQWVELSPTAIPQYLSKSFDEYLLSEQLAALPWYEQKYYCQKWQTSDIIKEQLQSNYDPINVTLIDQNDSTIVTVVATNVRLNRYEPGMYIYEWSISLAGIPEGCYFLKRTCGSPILRTFISEPINVKTTHEGTMLFEFKNSRFHADIVWETGIELSIRMEAGFPPATFTPGGKRNIYEDEKLNPTVLSAKPFGSLQLSIGGSFGIPDWLIKKLMWIWSCNSVKGDGKSYAMDSETFEFKGEDGYPLRGVIIKVREGINRASKIFTDAGVQNQKLVFAYNIETKLFGDLAAGGSSNTVKIKDVE